MTKQELEEKIKNEEIVWYIRYNNYDEQYDFLELHLKGNFIIKNKSDDYTKALIKCDDLGHMDYYICDLDNIFCTVEDAKFYLDYNNITKTEKLPFMTWEEFDKNYLGFEFSGKKGHQYRFWFNRDFKIQITDENLNKIEEWDATKENFYKAYKICKNLFLGE